MTTRPRPVYRTWLKFYSERWIIGGSTRAELEADERAVWLDVLCLANRLDGQFEVFDRDLLAQQLRISRELLDRAIAKFVDHKKIRKTTKKGQKSEVFTITNWKRYQYGEGERIVKPEKTHREKREKPEKTHPQDRTGLDRTGSDEDRTGQDEDQTAGNRPVSPAKRSFFELLKTVQNYPFDEVADGQIYDLFQVRYPTIDFIHETEKKIEFWRREGGLKKSASARTQLVNFFEQEVAYQTGKGR